MGQNKSRLSREELKKLKNTTKFSKAEIKVWYRGFIQDCPDGELSLNEFADIYRGFFPDGNSHDFAKMIFSVFDVNGDGTIQFDEFLNALSITSKGTMEEKLEWAFRIYDLDDSGTIDKEEMSRIITAMLSMAGETAGDTQEKAEARVEKIFQVMDVDGNGELSREEFLQAAKKDQSIVAALNFIRC